MTTEHYKDQLDELSKQTLGRYIKTSANDVAARGAHTRQLTVDAKKQRDAGDIVGSRKTELAREKNFEKSWARRAGMAKAVDRLTKESVLHLVDAMLESDAASAQQLINRIMTQKSVEALEDARADIASGMFN